MTAVSDPSPRIDRSKSERLRNDICWFFIIFLFGSVIWMVMLSFANVREDGSGFLVTLGSLGILSASALILGGFFGFLFGIPRSLAAPSPAQVQPNTNLEQISDWLTKVLVGVGLTQIGAICDSVKALAAGIEQIMPSKNLSPVIYIATLITFLFSGFLWGYFESRTSLMMIFSDWSKSEPLVPNREV